MDTLVSLAYTIIDSICICLFLDAFASHRWKGYRFFIGVILQTILMFSFVEFSVIILNRNQIAKVLLIILSCFITTRILYKNISNILLCFLVIAEYLLTYSLSFAIGLLATFICGVDVQVFQSDRILVLIYSIIYYSSEFFLFVLFRKVNDPAYVQQINGSCTQLTANPIFFISMCVICHAYDLALRHKWSRY